MHLLYQLIFTEQPFSKRKFTIFFFKLKRDEPENFRSKSQLIWTWPTKTKQANRQKSLIFTWQSYQTNIKKNSSGSLSITHLPNIPSHHRYQNLGSPKRWITPHLRSLRVYNLCQNKNSEAWILTWYSTHPHFKNKH